MSAPFRVSLSVSPHTEEVFETMAPIFTDGVREARNADELQELYAAHGATEVYARIATTRDTVVHEYTQTLDHAVERARLARRLGLQFNPEFGLWETYGDVRGQGPAGFSQFPELSDVGPWYELTLDEMCGALVRYGTLAAAAIVATGVEVVCWNIGNEVDFGTAGVATRPMDWYPGESRWQPPDRIDPEIGRLTASELVAMAPDTRVEWLRRHIWPPTARLLNAFADGVRAVDAAATVSTHLANGIGPELGVAFWTAMRENGYEPDIIGTSLYPSNSTHIQQSEIMAAAEATMTATGRPMFIAEYAYPAHPFAPGQGLFAGWSHQMPGYPLTDDGQSTLLEDLTRWSIRAGVVGIRPWAPEAVLEIWEPLALFGDEDGAARARPAIDAMARGVR